jgi:uncharacterized membrane protein YjdF
MPRERILFALLAVLLGLAVFNFVGITQYLFWTFWWYDFVAHFLGGISAGLGAVWILSLRNKGYDPALSVVVVLVVGILWEGFEAYFKLALFPFDAWDTFTDLSFDVLGGVCGILFARSIVSPR